MNIWPHLKFVQKQYEERNNDTNRPYIPVPEGPFKYLVMVYVDMIKRVQGKGYMLVVIDRFNRWVKAVSSADQGSGTAITFITREVIPRFDCNS